MRGGKVSAYKIKCLSAINLRYLYINFVNYALMEVAVDECGAGD